jgi:hypothetical protein
LEQIIRVHEVDANLAVYGAGYVDQVVEATSETVGEFEFSLGKHSECLVQVLSIEGLWLFGDHGDFSIKLVAADGGMAFTIDVTESDVATANDRVKFPSLIAY